MNAHWLFCLVCVGQAAVAADSPRETSLVKTIRRIEPSVTAVFSQHEEGRLNSGSGSVIHEDGFILTADHVVRGFPGVVLLKGHRPLRYRTVARLPEKDLAVLQVHVPNKLNPISLGRSHDLMTGEPILTVGTSAAVRYLTDRPVFDPHRRTWCYIADDTRFLVGAAWALPIPSRRKPTGGPSHPTRHHALRISAYSSGLARPAGSAGPGAARTDHPARHRAGKMAA